MVNSGLDSMKGVINQSASKDFTFGKNLEKISPTVSMENLHTMQATQNRDE